MILYSKIGGLVLGIVSCTTLLSVGCAGWLGEVPSQLRVDSGIEPDKQDKYVRFRTTYYFRVVDSCTVEAGIDDGGDYEYRSKVFNVRKKGLLRIVNDSLYRFRMTGQASALFNDIHFESGVLRAEQIDPFGSAIAYDKSTRTFRVEPASTRRGRAQRDETYAEVERLRRLYVDVGKDGQPKTLQPDVEVLIKRQLQILAEGKDLYDGTTPTRVTDQSVRCPDGRPAKRSYYLYGPEGVRELDPDERLLMAMSSDSKPVISLLQQMSNKQLQQQGSATSTLPDLIGERVWVFDAQQDLGEAGDQLRTDAALNVSLGPVEIAKRLIERADSARARTRTQGGNTP
jgi:hypothetical protein